LRVPSVWNSQPEHQKDSRKFVPAKIKTVNFIASGKLVGEGDFEAQVEQVFRNLKLAVEAAGGTMADIVKLNYFLVAEVEQASVPRLRPIRTATSMSRIRRPRRSSSFLGCRGRAGLSKLRRSRRSTTLLRPPQVSLGPSLPARQ
jgi:hypothetical protein